MRSIPAVTVITLTCARLAAPDVIETREAAVGHDMKVVELKKPIRIEGGPAGELGRSIVPRGVTPTESIALFIRVVRRGTLPFDVVVKPTAGGTETIYASTGNRASSDEFWTLPMAGYHAAVEVRPAAGNTERPAVEVVAYGRAEEPAVPEQLCGQPDAIGADAAPAAYRAWLPPVARVRFFNKKKRAHCTGFLVGSDVLMTNYHCARTEVVPGAMTVHLGYDKDSDVPEELMVSKRLAFDSTLDFALLRLERAASAQFGRLHLSRATDPLPSNLVLIGHPDGTTKMLSIDECRPEGPGSVNLFGHHCDTAGGSSGSPVLDRASGAVVGLHHVGVIGCGKNNLANEAVRARQIVSHLQGEATGGRIDQALVDEVIR